MYKRYGSFLPCMHKGCGNKPMFKSNYCYEHFDMLRAS